MHAGLGEDLEPDARALPRAQRRSRRQFDVAPVRHLEEKIPSGPAKGHKVGRENFEYMLDDYYYNRGWDKKGHPTREVLEILGIGHIADNLEKAGLLGEPFDGGVPKVRGEKLKPNAM